MNVPIRRLYFSLKKTKPCFEEVYLIRRSYVMTYYVFQKDVFHAANYTDQLLLEMLGVIFLVHPYIIPVDIQKYYFGVNYISK